MIPTSNLTTEEFLTDAVDYYMGDSHRRCWIQNKDLRRIRLAIHERESRTWWQQVQHAALSVLGVFLP